MKFHAVYKLHCTYICMGGCVHLSIIAYMYYALLITELHPVFCAVGGHGKHAGFIIMIPDTVDSLTHQAGTVVKMYYYQLISKGTC